jgi:hypothetical protein
MQISRVFWWFVAKVDWFLLEPDLRTADLRAANFLACLRMLLQKSCCKKADAKKQAISLPQT